MAGDVRQFIRRSGVTVRYATATGSGVPALADFDEIAHLQGQLTVNDSRNAVTVRDFDSNEVTFDLQYVDGRTGSVTFGLNLVPSDAIHQALKTDYDTAAVGYLWVDASDGKATASKFTEAFVGQIQTFPRNYNQDNVATGNLTFLIQDTFTPPTA